MPCTFWHIECCSLMNTIVTLLRSSSKILFQKNERKLQMRFMSRVEILEAVFFCMRNQMQNFNYSDLHSVAKVELCGTSIPCRLKTHCREFLKVCSLIVNFKDIWSSKAWKGLHRVNAASRNFTKKNFINERYFEFRNE